MLGMPGLASRFHKVLSLPGGKDIHLRETDRDWEGHVGTFSAPQGEASGDTKPDRDVASHRAVIHTRLVSSASTFSCSVDGAFASGDHLEIKGLSGEVGYRGHRDLRSAAPVRSPLPPGREIPSPVDADGRPGYGALVHHPQALPAPKARKPRAHSLYRHTKKMTTGSSEKRY
ncbi:hypothetical protein CTA1_1725 [Colletotrichum tanaceti]|uniref:Uncharacterized protein n=1 Tax=Colletotrichum tanaceti TaxID=1306861 RepID=A0A4U6XEH1_9PEZI|nr:hypothetical protein CTA1_1725 [Colletotrichum tanaceti]